MDSTAASSKQVYNRAYIYTITLVYIYWVLHYSFSRPYLVSCQVIKEPVNIYDDGVERSIGIFWTLSSYPRTIKRRRRDEYPFNTYDSVAACVAVAVYIVRRGIEGMQLKLTRLASHPTLTLNLRSPMHTIKEMFRLLNGWTGKWRVGFWERHRGWAEASICRMSQLVDISNARSQTAYYAFARKRKWRGTNIQIWFIYRKIEYKSAAVESN